MRQQGLSRDDIAAHYGVALSRVKRWIKQLDIPAVTNRSEEAMRKNRSPGANAVGDDFGLTLIERAKNTLGPRVSQDYRGYLLDGRPVRVDILVRSAGLDVPDVP
jgi:transposase